MTKAMDIQRPSSSDGQSWEVRSVHLQAGRSGCPVPAYIHKRVLSESSTRQRSSHQRSGGGPRIKSALSTFSEMMQSMQLYLESFAILMAGAPHTRCAIIHSRAKLPAFPICGAQRSRLRSTWSASWAILRRSDRQLFSACSRTNFSVILVLMACQSAAIANGITS